MARLSVVFCALAVVGCLKPEPSATVPEPQPTVGISPKCRATTEQRDEQFLSDVDPGYNKIEELQEKYGRGVELRGAEFRVVLETIPGVSAEERQNLQDRFDALNAAPLATRCSSRTTRWIVGAYVKIVEEAAPRAFNFALTPNVAYDSVRSPGRKSMGMVGPAPGQYLMLFDTLTLRLHQELADTIAFVVEKPADLAAPGRLRAALRTKPKVRRYLAAAVVQAVGGKMSIAETPPVLFPALDYRQVELAGRLESSGGVFVAAHEYFHALDALDYLDADSQINPWEVETLADLFAIDVLQEAGEEGGRRGEYMLGPAVHFTAMTLLLNTERLLEPGTTQMSQNSAVKCTKNYEKERCGTHPPLWVRRVNVARDPDEPLRDNPRFYWADEVWSAIEADVIELLDGEAERVHSAEREGG